MQQTPADFMFAVKASRYLTHIRRLQDTGEGIARFYERIEPLIEHRRLGPVLWQLPANFKRDDERLERLAGGAARGDAHDRVSPPELVRSRGHATRCGLAAWR